MGPRKHCAQDELSQLLASQKASAVFAQQRKEQGLAENERRCSRCSAVKIETDFSVQGRTKAGLIRRHTYCKACSVEYNRIEKLRAVFNLSPEEDDKITAHQQNKCAICGREPKADGNRLSTDHDHKTGLIRGKLCWLCNRLLGMLRDDLEMVKRVVAYLQDPPAVHALGEPRYGNLGRTTKKRPKRKLA